MVTPTSRTTMSTMPISLHKGLALLRLQRRPLTNLRTLTLTPHPNTPNTNLNPDPGPDGEGESMLLQAVAGAALLLCFCAMGLLCFLRRGTTRTFGIGVARMTAVA